MSALAAWLLSAVLAGIAVVAIYRATHGMFVYPLDDTYIHLTVAKMLALHGVWGINPTTFASASSAPGWTLLLMTVDRVAGVHLLTPLFLNGVFALALSWIVCETVRTSVPRAPAWSGFLVAAAVVVLCPVTAMWVMGMEHVVQTLAVLLLLWLGAVAISRDASQHGAGVCVAAALATSIRYEGVFAVGAVVLLLLLRKRLLAAAAVAVSGALPVLLFGLYFHAESGYFLPYSVIVKASYGLPGFVPVLTALGGVSPVFGALLPLLLFLLAARVAMYRQWQQDITYGALVSLVTLAHLLLARNGWLQRYEAYVISALVTGIGVLIASFVWSPASDKSHEKRSGVVPPRVLWGVTALLILLSANPMMRRFWSGQILTPLAAVDRLDEHIQMVNFVARYYDTSTIVLDDIGAVSYFTHAHLLDLVGLGSVEPVRAAHARQRFTPQDMQQWAAREQASIAILQPNKETSSHIPPSWILVQTWKQPHNVVFHDFLTSFYAVRPQEVARLCASLSEFKLIPADAIVYNSCPASKPL